MLRAAVVRHVTHLALLVPFAIVGVACGDDTSFDSSDAGAGTSGEGGPKADAAAGSDARTGGDATSTPDTTAPTVLSTSPGPAAVGVPTNAALTVDFDEPMAPLSIGKTSFTLKAGANAVDGTVTYFDSTATFAPTADLALNTSYTATITTTATDVAGNALAAAHAWTFTTDSVAPMGPAPVLLGAAGKYAILAKSAISNVPSSKVTGNLGLSPAAGSYITGFALTRAGTKWTSAQVVGSVFAADSDPPTPSNLTTAIGDMQTAYTDAAGRPTPTSLNLGAGTVGGVVLTPGLYKWTTGVTVPLDITLSGAANDVWIFQIAGDLKMSAATAMKLVGGARPKNVFWQVTGAVELGTTAHAEGIVLSKTAITLATGASINGRLLAQTAVTLASTTVTAP